jgi:hypothetical protein
MFNRFRSLIAPAWLLMLLLVAAASNQAQAQSLVLPNCAGTLKQYAVCEIPLTPVNNYSELDAYTNMDVTATFTNSNGTSKVVHGFYDKVGTGPLLFKIRFNASETGTWTYNTTCTTTGPAAVSCNADGGLNNKPGNFTVNPFVVGSTSEPGFLRRDSIYKEKLVYDNGSYPLIWGQTYYHIITNALANPAGDKNWTAAVSKSKATGLDKVRMLLYPYWDYAPYGDSQPFNAPGGPTLPNHDRLNQRHWQKFDVVINYLYDNFKNPTTGIHDSVIAELILFKDPAINSTTKQPEDGQRTFGTPAQDRRYVKYAIARYAAFPNVIWCLANEWELARKWDASKDFPYWDDLGTILIPASGQSYDPWMLSGTKQRATSIHQNTNQLFEFFGHPWFAHAVIQFGTGNTGCLKNVPGTVTPVSFQCVNGDDWGYYGITYNLFRDVGTRRLRPVANDEYGYFNDPKTKTGPFIGAESRQTVWGIAMAGGYGSAGDLTGASANLPTPTLSSEWIDHPVEYKEILLMKNFFTQNVTRWWEMSTPFDPSTIVVPQTATRVYVLARTPPAANPQYVIYAATPGSFNVKLPQGNYSSYFYDPTSGGISGGQSFNIDGITTTQKNFSTPTASDYALLITKTS